MFRMRIGTTHVAALAGAVLLVAVNATVIRAQGGTSNAPGPHPALTAALAAVVKVEGVDSTGKVLTISNGTLFKEGLVVQTAALAGSQKARVTTRAGKTWDLSAVEVTRGLIGLSLLKLPTAPPSMIEYPAKTSYMAKSRIFLLNGPGVGPDSVSARIYQNFTIHGAPDVCPTDVVVAGAAPALDETGRLLGVTCEISDSTGKVSFIVPTVSVKFLTSSTPATQPMSTLASLPIPDFLDGKTATGLLFRGAIMAQAEKNDAAHRYLRLAQAKDISLAEAHFWDGKVLFAQEQFKQAAEEFQVAAAKDPTDYLAWHMAGAALNQAGDYAGAEAMYKKALEVKPTAADSYCNLGGAYYNLQKTDDALAAFRKSIELDPRYGGGIAYFNLAIVLKRLGRGPESEQVYQDLLKIDASWAQRLRQALDETK